VYGEREVNALLGRDFDDTASLRRYLVDGELLKRQVVRVVGMQALVEGNPEVDLQITYWRPEPGSR
jgi:hypothetical protein